MTVNNNREKLIDELKESCLKTKSRRITKETMDNNKRYWNEFKCFVTTYGPSLNVLVGVYDIENASQLPPNLPHLVTMFVAHCCKHIETEKAGETRSTSKKEKIRSAIGHFYRQLTGLDTWSATFYDEVEYGKGIPQNLSMFPNFMPA